MPPKPTTRFSVRLSPEGHATIAGYAAARHITKTAALECILTEWRNSE